jgi:hypothetical protein
MSDIALICAASILHAVTFAAGVLIGTSLRKDARHDDSNEGTTIKDADWWHDPVGPGTQGGIVCRGGSGAKQERQARSAERALG